MKRRTPAQFGPYGLPTWLPSEPSYLAFVGRIVAAACLETNGRRFRKA